MQVPFVCLILAEIQCFNLVLPGFCSVLGRFRIEVVVGHALKAPRFIFLIQYSLYYPFLATRCNSAFCKGLALKQLRFLLKRHAEQIGQEIPNPYSEPTGLSVLQASYCLRIAAGSSPMAQ